jgi:hypothetical protein
MLLSLQKISTSLTDVSCKMETILDISSYAQTSANKSINQLKK